MDTRSVKAKRSEIEAKAPIYSINFRKSAAFLFYYFIILLLLLLLLLLFLPDLWLGQQVALSQVCCCRRGQLANLRN